MKGKNLMDEISVSELLQMREEGMSNQEIADALDVSYYTIVKYIGGAPKSVRKPREFHEDVAKKEAPPEVAPACLVIQNKQIELHGVMGVYVVDCKKKTVLAQFGETMLDIAFDKLGDVIGELQAIKRKTSELIVENEMW